jgi:type II secretory pathway component PulC
MLSDNDKTRKRLGPLPVPIKLPAFHLLAKPYLPLFAATILSLIWTGLIVQSGLKIHRAFQASATDKIPHATSQTDNLLQPAAIDIAAVTALNLFGKVEIKPAEMDASTLPVTTANLKLVGLFASSQPGASRSLISEQDKPAKSYAEGDILPGNITIFKIENDCVIVQRADQYEKLSLPGSQIGKPAKPVHSFTEIAQAQSQTATSAPLPTVSKNEMDGNKGPQAIYHQLEARLAALKKKKI